MGMDMEKFHLLLDIHLRWLRLFIFFWRDWYLFFFFPSPSPLLGHRREWMGVFGIKNLVLSWIFLLTHRRLSSANGLRKLSSKESKLSDYSRPFISSLELLSCDQLEPSIQKTRPHHISQYSFLCYSSSWRWLRAIEISLARLLSSAGGVLPHRLLLLDYR